MSHEHWVFMLSPYKCSVGVLFQKRVHINLIASTSHYSKPLWPRQNPPKKCMPTNGLPPVHYIPPNTYNEVTGNSEPFSGDRRDPLPKYALEDDIFLALSFSNMEYKSYIGWKTMLDPLVAILGQCWQLFINTPYMESVETLPTSSFWVVDFLGQICKPVQYVEGPQTHEKVHVFRFRPAPPPSNPRPAKTVPIKMDFKHA